METIHNIENNCISDRTSLMEALNRLEKARPKVLFAVDNSGRLISSVTDGDIRRAILSGASLDSKIVDFTRHEPIVLKDSDDTSAGHSQALALMKRYDISAIPVVDNNGVILKIFTRDMPKHGASDAIDVPVVIMAGGKGTRLYPYTRILPKPLIPVADVPISERIIESFRAVGCRDFHMIVNYRRNMIKAYYGESEHEYNITFYDEDRPLGTGGGLKVLEGVIDGTFVMTNCDILIMDDLSQILRHHREEGNSVTMVCSLKNFEIPYGVVNISEGGEIESFEEKPKMSFFTNTGYYVLEKDVFEHIGTNENIGMPDIIERMKAAGLKVGMYPIGETSWLDMGQFDSMESMEAYIKGNHIDEL